MADLSTEGLFITREKRDLSIHSQSSDPFNLVATDSRPSSSSITSHENLAGDNKESWPVAAARRSKFKVEHRRLSNERLRSLSTTLKQRLSQESRKTASSSRENLEGKSKEDIIMTRMRLVAEEIRPKALDTPQRSSLAEKPKSPFDLVYPNIIHLAKIRSLSLSAQKAAPLLSSRTSAFPTPSLDPHFVQCYVGSKLFDLDDNWTTEST